VALVAEAQAARRLISSDPDKSIAAIAAASGRRRTRLGKLVALSCLAPDIVTATVIEVALPLAWADQRALLGFS